MYRVFGSAGSDGRREAQALVRAVMPEGEEDVRIFNQAMMELGAVVCVPKGPPRCGECPGRDLCLGRLRGTAESLPVRAAKKPRRVEEKTVFLLLRRGEIALRRRGDWGLLAGLWEFPNVEGRLDEAAAARAVKEYGLTAMDWGRRLTAKHVFTHVEWHMTGYTLEAAGRGPEDFLWVDGRGLAEHAVPSAFARYYEEALRLLGEEG